MSTSPGSSLLLAVAVAEAQLTESTHLDPEHIFLALLKSEDISAEKVEEMPPPLLKAAVNELQKTAAFWQQEGISAKRLRRRLRAIVRESKQIRGNSADIVVSGEKRPFKQAEAFSQQGE